jgi:hypothetical protein
MHFVKLLLALVLLFSFAVPVLPPAIAQDGAGDNLPAMGMNITTPSYYDGFIYFNDATRHGSHWISFAPENPAEWDDQRDIPLTMNGYPAALAADQAARQIIFLESEIAPEGDYTLTWAGSGEIGVQLDFVEDIIFTESDDRRQTIRVTRNDENQLHMFIIIYATNPDDPIRDVRLYLPGTDENSPRFTPWLLERLAPFSVIRFMDWNWTNYTDVSTWNERPQLGWTSWGAEMDNFIGVPYEVQIELANTMGMDMWVNVPHLADDDHVQQLADLIRAELDPSLQVWVEYSNEAWNPIFPVFEHLVLEAEQVAAAEDNDEHFIYHQYGRRAGEVMAIFDAVFADQPNRMIGVLGAQAGYAIAAEFAIDEAREQGTLQYFDTLGLAPYFGDAWENEDGGNVNALTSQLWTDETYSAEEYDAIFNLIESNIDAMFSGSDEYGTEMLANRELAQENNLTMVTYEAGQSLTAGYFGNGMPEGVYIPVNRHPRMYDLYMQYLDGWQAFGGETMVMFHLGGFWNGSETFGHLENPFQPLDNAHKYRALLDWLAQQPE